MRITMVTVDNENLRSSLLRIQIGTVETTINLKDLCEREIKKAFDTSKFGDDWTEHCFVDVCFYH